MAIHTASCTPLQLLSSGALPLARRALFSSYKTNHYRSHEIPRRSPSFHGIFKALRVAMSMRLNASQPRTPLQGCEATWEEPFDGSESEYEDSDDDVNVDNNPQENDLDYESDWEEQRDNLVVTSNETALAVEQQVDFIKEVEVLLEPEEREILEDNDVPNLRKISSAKWIPLHTLALAGQIKFLDSLLEMDFDIELTDKDGLTALHVAITSKKEPVISHLLRKGANPHVKDKNGASPLHYAVQVGAIQTVKLLIKNNIDVDIADNEGWTPLHIAMQSRNRDIAKVLLVNGADPTRRNKDGKSPLDLSMAYGKEFKSYDLAKLLKNVPARRGL